MHIAHTSKFFKNLYTTAYLLETFFKVFFSDFIWPLKYVHTYVYSITASKKASFFYVRILWVLWGRLCFPVSTMTTTEVWRLSESCVLATGTWHRLWAMMSVSTRVTALILATTTIPGSFFCNVWSVNSRLTHN